jgi:hypothetical protein
MGTTIVTETKLVATTALSLTLWKLTNGHSKQLRILVMPQALTVSTRIATEVAIAG